jgi:hypothetical protein
MNAVGKNRFATVLAGLGNLAHIAAALAIAYTALLATRELKALHEQRDLEALWRLHEKLESDVMRSNLAALPSIARPATVAALSGDDEKGGALRDIANFYEMIALTVHKGYVRCEDVDSYIGNDILAFWSGIEEAVHKLRDAEHRPQAYAELEWLANRIRKSHGYPGNT